VIREIKTRKPAVAGQFYPGDERSLSEMLDKLFYEAEKDIGSINGVVNALVAPHAGYVFSGKQAAKAYACLKDHSYDLVCIISPSHREYFPAISVYPGESYITPMGKCLIDDEARKTALSCEGIVPSLEGHRSEHALEVQLPFIQKILGNIRILPMVMGDQSAQSINETSECVKKLYEKYHDNVLFVASSDLSHFHPAHIAKEMDGEFIRLLNEANSEMIFQKLQDDELEACGGGPILSILKGLDISSNEIFTLGYSHSGQVLSDNDSVVGYTSAVMIKG